MEDIKLNRVQGIGYWSNGNTHNIEGYKGTVKKLRKDLKYIARANCWSNSHKPNYQILYRVEDAKYTEYGSFINGRWVTKTQEEAV